MEQGEFELGTDGPSVILVGLDGSRTSRRATAWAAGLARRQGAKLVVVFVQRPSASAAMAPAAKARTLPRDPAEQARRSARASIQQCGGTPGPKVGSK